MVVILSLKISHNRNAVWKGMLRVDLNTPGDDVAARQELANIAL